MFQVGGEAGRTSAASVSASAAASTAAFTPTLLQGLTNNLSSPSQSNNVPPTPPAVGKLIDLSTSDLDSGGGAQQIPLTIKHLEQEEKRKSALVDPRALLQSPDGSDTWDYVYKTLDRIGYNTKDAAAAAGGSERPPDALELLNKVTQARQRALEREGQGGAGAGQESPQWSQEEQELLLRIQRTQLDDGDRGAEERPRPPTTSSTQDGGRSSSGLFLTESPSERDEPDAVHPRFRRDAGGAASVDNSSPNQDSVGGNNNVPSSNNINSAVSEDYSTVVRGPDGTKKSLRHSRPLEPPSDQVQQQQQQSNKDRRPNLSETDGGRRSRAHDEEVLKQQQQHPRSYSAAALSGLPNWSCYACTFENGPGVDICEMCGKSRPASSASATGESSCGEEDSLGSAAVKGGGGRGEGRVCPRCTLVNPKEARVCEACEEKLGGGRGRRSGGGGGGGGSRRQKR